MSRSEQAPRFRLGPFVVAGLAVVALVCWSFAIDAEAANLRGGLFLIASGAVVAAFGRHIGPALVVVGVMALAMHRAQLEALDVWAAVFLVTMCAGAAIWLRPLGPVRWLAASAPFWALSKAHPFFEFAGPAVALVSLISAAVGPTLPGRRLRRAVHPLPQMANGPLVPITARTFQAAKRQPWLGRIAWGLAATAAALFVLVATGRAGPSAGGLAVSAAIIAVTFAFANWFAGRMRLSVDADGLHARALLRTTTVRWTEVAGLTIRDVWLPGYGAHIIYYVAYSPTTEFAFLGSMADSEALRASIEAATGLRWPEPARASTF